MVVGMLKRAMMVMGWAALVAGWYPVSANAAQEDPIELPEMVVTGTRTGRLLTDTPVKTEVVGAREMEGYNLTSLRDSLKLIPTVRFEYECQNCGVNQIQMLGLSTDYTAILFDGAPLYSGLAKVYGADLFPAIFINRIEVVKGGSSVLYGPEAMAGVVNLITAEPVVSGLSSMLSYRTVLGDADTWESAVKGDYVDAQERFRLTAYGYYLDRAGLDLGADGFTDLAEFENRVAGVQAWWHPQSNATVKANFQFMDQAHRGGDRLDLPEEQARVAESLAHDIHLVQVSWKQWPTSSFDYHLSFSYIFIERTSFYGARADNEQRAFEEAGFAGDVTEAFIDANQAAIDALARKVWGLTENHVYYADAQFNHNWIAHTVSYGVQYRFEDLTDGSLYDAANTPTTKDDFSNFGVFIQDQWMLSERFELVPGLRVDWHDNVDGEVLSPRLAAKFHAADTLTLRASWSTGFNAPGAFNEDKHIGVNNGGAIFLINEPGLQEERSHTFSVGADYRPAAFEGQLFLHSQIHQTSLSDVFEIDDSGELSGDPNLWLRFNGPDAAVFVWENSLNWQMNGALRLDAGVSYIRARYDDPIERVTGLTTRSFIEQPEWTGHLGLSYENHDSFDAYALYSYTGAMLAVGQDADIWRNTPHFHVLDLGISKSLFDLAGIPELTVAIGVDNVFDQRQKDLQDNGEERDPTYLYGPTQPRSFYLRLNAKW
jgi:outer membrane receptor for ferrienterochelin and colicins